MPFEGTEEQRKAKAEELLDEYYGLDHEDMVRSSAPLLLAATLLSRVHPLTSHPRSLPYRSVICRHDSTTPRRPRSHTVSRPPKS